MSGDTFIATQCRTFGAAEHESGKRKGTEQRKKNEREENASLELMHVRQVLCI